MARKRAGLTGRSSSPFRITCMDTLHFHRSQTSLLLLDRDFQPPFISTSWPSRPFPPSDMELRDVCPFDWSAESAHAGRGGWTWRTCKCPLRMVLVSMTVGLERLVRVTGCEDRQTSSTVCRPAKDAKRHDMTSVTVRGKSFTNRMWWPVLSARRRDTVIWTMADA